MAKTATAAIGASDLREARARAEALVRELEPQVKRAQGFWMPDHADRVRLEKELAAARAEATRLDKEYRDEVAANARIDLTLAEGALADAFDEMQKAEDEYHQADLALAEARRRYEFAKNRYADRLNARGRASSILARCAEIEANPQSRERIG